MNAEKIFLNDTWTMYAHVHCVSNTYINSIIPIFTFDNISDFWCMFNNIPSAKDLHENIVMLSQKQLVAYSLFKNDITPEWEHHINANGSELGCRTYMNSGLFEQIWLDFILLAIGNDPEFKNVVGVRCINKSNKLRKLFKIEVWLQTYENELAIPVKEKISEFVPEWVEFSFMKHEDKQTQANDFINKKGKKKIK